jgi:hypothetical protein
MSQEKILQKAILRVLKPLIRILLRNNIPFGAFSEMARQAYVEVATHDFKVEGRKQSNSRISTITGLSRKEVKRLQELEETTDSILTEKYNRAARVVYGWVHDKTYQNKKGISKILSFDTGDQSFSALVKKYSGDVPPRAILDELERVGVVEIDDKGFIHLLSRAYIPKTGVNEKIQYLGSDVSALLNTMDRNIYEENKSKYFQRKVYYDNLPNEVIDELKQMIAENSQQLLEKIDIAMAEHDRDANPDVKGTGRKAIGVGIYYFENKDIEEQGDE